MFEENERQCYETQWAMGNVKSVSKYSKISVFLMKTGQQITTRRSTEWCFIDFRGNISIYKLIVETGLQFFCPLKKSEKWNFYRV